VDLYRHQGMVPGLYQKGKADMGQNSPVRRSCPAAAVALFKKIICGLAEARFDR
jgi:hypothetical protein